MPVSMYSVSVPVFIQHLGGLAGVLDTAAAHAAARNIKEADLLAMRLAPDMFPLVRVSHTPGRTQELVFFSGDAVLTLVDMPGYGYAAAPKAKIKAWTALVHAYLRGRANLARVYVLIDARHGLKDSDAPSLDVLGEAAVSHQIVLTKTDQVTRAELEGRTAQIENMLKARPAAFPQVIATSSRTGAGIAELRAAIAKMKSERGV